MRALIPAFAVVLLVAATAQASSVREVGDYKDAPLPQAGCPDPNTCQAVGHVTGYQVQIGKHRNPYVIHHDGKVVAFTIRLGKPDAKQTTFFTNLFGGAPQARVSVLKKPKSDKRGTTDLKVLAQSEVFNLANYLGSTPTFALSKPLPVSAGSTLAVTVPTWAPSFAINLGADQAWRSSRPKNDCNGTSQAALQTVGKVGFFDCYYKTARLLYTVTFVPDPQPTK
jgi:hypothetical protein